MHFSAEFVHAYSGFNWGRIIAVSTFDQIAAIKCYKLPRCGNVDNVMGYDMAKPVQLRILPNNGSGWYWKVINQDREVITGGVSDTHIQARTDAMNAGLGQRPQEIHRTGLGRLSWRMIWSAVSQATDKFRFKIRD
jgi:hypothetical protein